MPKIKAIFFDLDDTLVDSRKAEKEAAYIFKKQFSEFDNINKEDFENLWHQIAIEQYKRYDKGEISYKKHRVNRIKSIFSEFNVEKNDEEALDIFNIYLKEYQKNWKLFNDAKKILKKMKRNYKLVLITNGDSVQQREKIRKTKIEKYFSEIIISGEVGITKPKKEIFELACTKIEEQPENCIMIGDSYKLDIQGAQNAGLNAIWVNRRGEEFKEENQIKELKELLNWNL